MSNLVANDDAGWSEWAVTGTHKGIIPTPAGPIAPTNRFVEFSDAKFVRVSRGLIVEERVFADTAEFMRQLGLKPGS
jgi:predicted ester cyclase